MRKMHPLRVWLDVDNKYLFRFRTAAGDKAFEFSVVNNGSAIEGISAEFSLLADNDMAERCIYGCILALNHARVAGGVRFGQLMEPCEPVAIEFLGKSAAETSKYIVDLKDPNGAYFREEVLVSHKEPAKQVLWSGGQCSFGYDQFARLAVLEPKPSHYKIIDAILQFDNSRYMISYPDESPMEIDL